MLKSLNISTSIMGDYIRSNALFQGQENANKTVAMDDCDFSIDGNLVATSGITSFPTISTNCRFNISLFPIMYYLTFKQSCTDSLRADQMNGITIINCTFFGHNTKASFALLQLYSQGDAVLINNTFTDLSFPILPNLNFFTITNLPSCDIAHRTQNLILDGNKFINLTNSGISIAYIYQQAFSAKRIFQITNNHFENSIFDQNVISILVGNSTPITFANNTYKNVTINSGFHMFYTQAPKSNISLVNETIKNAIADDFYYIISVWNILIQNVIFNKIWGTGVLSASASLIRIANLNNLGTIYDLELGNSSLLASSFFRIENGFNLSMSNIRVGNCTLETSSLFSLSFLQIIQMEGILLNKISKLNDQMISIIEVPTLKLSQNISFYSIISLNLANSNMMLFKMSSFALGTKNQINQFEFKMKNVTLILNSLKQGDYFFSFGTWHLDNLYFELTDFLFENNTITESAAISMQMNTLNFSVANFTFLNNEGSLFKVSPKLLEQKSPLVLSISNSIFAQNNGLGQALFQIESNIKLYVFQTSFIENLSYGKGSVIRADYQNAVAVFEQCEFFRNFAMQGGVFLTQFRSQVIIKSSLIQNNFAIMGGVGFVDNDGSAEISGGSKVIGNMAVNTCILYIANSQSKSRVFNVEIEKNIGLSKMTFEGLFQKLLEFKFLSGKFMINLSQQRDYVERLLGQNDNYQFTSLKARLEINNTLISESESLINCKMNSQINIFNMTIQNCSVQGPIIQAIYSSITITSSRFMNLYKTLESKEFFLIQAISKSSLVVSSSSIENTTGISNFYAYDSTFTVQNDSYFQYWSNNNTKHPLIYVEKGILKMDNCHLNQLSSGPYRKVIQLLNSTALISSCDFSFFTGTLYSISYGSADFTKITVENGRGSIGQKEALVISSVNADISIEESEFKNIHHSDSRAVISHSQLISASSNQYFLQISDSKFINNSASNSAGAIYTFNSNFNISNCIFAYNSALLGNGGALMLECSEQKICLYDIKESKFQDNFAFFNGGAIKYTSSKPILYDSNQFKGNQAQYGNDLASYPYQLNYQSSDSSNLSLLLSQNQAFLLGYGAFKVISLDEVQVSGGIVTKSFEITLLDEQGIRIVTDNTTFATLVPISQNVSVNKMKSTQAVNGVFTFSGVEIVGIPGQTIFLEVQVPAIEKVRERNASIQGIIVSLSLRYCGIGEYQSSDSRCFLCEAGFYNLNMNQSQCQKCPDNALCKGGSSLQVNDGYWRESINSSIVYKCFNDSACLASEDSQCAPGYKGNLCGSCSKYNESFYFKRSLFDCQKCSTRKQNLLKTFGQVTLLVAYVIFVIATTLKQIYKKQDQVVALRILTSYFQLVTIIVQYELKWTDMLSLFLNYSTYISYLQREVLSIDCYIQQQGYSIHPQFAKIIMTLFFPGGCILLVILLFSVIKLIKREAFNFESNSTQSTLVIIYLVLPCVSYMNLSIFNCTSLFEHKSQTYMVLDLDIICWEDKHSHYAKIFGVPTILVWTVFVPFAIFAQLFKVRNNLKCASNLHSFGFLYVGLKEQHFYWEFVLYLEKLLLIGVGIFLAQYESIYRATTGFVLMCAFTEIELLVRPYENTHMHHLEVLKNIPLVLLFYTALFCITDDLPKPVYAIMMSIFVVTTFFLYAAMLIYSFDKQYKQICRKCCHKGQPKMRNREQDQLQEQGFPPDLEQDRSEIQLKMLNEYLKSERAKSQKRKKNRNGLKKVQKPSNEEQKEEFVLPNIGTTQIQSDLQSVKIGIIVKGKRRSRKEKRKEGRHEIYKF